MAQHRGGVVEKFLMACRKISCGTVRIVNATTTAMNVYSDTSSLFSNAERHADAKSQQEATSIAALLKLHKQGKITMLRSNVIRRELERTREASQRYALLDDFLRLVPVANDEKVLGYDKQLTDPYGGFVINPLVSDVQDEHLVEKLRRDLNLSLEDAQHLAQAISNQADIFLTRDEEHFIKQRLTIEARFKIKIRLPSELLAEI
jgi:predicted nucleic acid-binding protein